MKNKKIVLALTVFLSSFSVYLMTLSPSVYVGDSGELISASYNLGVAHPPGYPLYVLLGKLSAIIPFSNIAYRLNLFSALCASLTAMILFLSLIELCSNYASKTKKVYFSEISVLFSAFSASFFLIFSPLFWSQAVFAEVFTLNTFLISLVLLLILRGNLLPAFFLYGLSMGNHHSALLCLPVFLYIIWLFNRKYFSLHSLFLCLILFALGLCIYALIPLRALSDCKINWGHADTFSKFLRILLREDYGNTFSLKPFIGSFSSSSFLLSRVFAYLSSFYNQFLFIGTFLALIGFITDKYKVSLFFFAATGLSFPFLLSAYFSPGIKVLIERFFILSSVFACMGIFFGILFLTGFFHKKAKYLKAFIPIILLSPFFSLYADFSRKDLSKNYIPRNYAMNILSNIESNSTLFVYEGDAIVNSMVYLTKVENIFPKIALYESEIRVLDNPYGKDYIYLTKSQRKLRRARVENEYLENPTSPVYFVTVGIKEDENISQYGLIYRAKKHFTGSYDFKESVLWKKYDLRGFREDEIHKDFRTRNLISNYHYRLALYHKKNAELSEMLEEIELCSKTAFDMEWIQNNLGNFYSVNDMQEKERESYEKAVKINPTFAEGYYNLGVIHMAKKQYEKAIGYYEKALKIDPLYARAAWNLASAYSMLGDNNKMAYYLSLYIKLAPNDSEGVNEARRIINSLKYSNPLQ